MLLLLLEIRHGYVTNSRQLVMGGYDVCHSWSHIGQLSCSRAYSPAVIIRDAPDGISSISLSPRIRIIQSKAPIDRQFPYS